MQQYSYYKTKPELNSFKWIQSTLTLKCIFLKDSSKQKSFFHEFNISTNSKSYARNEMKAMFKILFPKLPMNVVLF